MNILFSPVGTADPVTALGDGPMLHIVRHYRPDTVYLFFSQRMKGFEDCDHRYTKAIDLLCEQTGQPHPDVHTITSDSDVHLFDGFIAEFGDRLRGIRKAHHLSKHDQEPILVNMSSGTPQMLQALAVLGAFGELPLSLIQVSSPRGDTNKKDDREDPDNYDLDLLWECNPDREEVRASRCTEVVLPNFKSRILRGEVQALVSAYDYEGALRLIGNVPDFPEQARNQIESLAQRLLNNRQYEGEYAARTTEMMKDYLAMLEVRKNQGHWADFVRALTPALTMTMERVLREHGLPEDDYLLPDGKGGYEGRLARLKVEKNDRLMSVGAVKTTIDYGSEAYVKNWMLIDVVREYLKDDPRGEETVAKLQALRKFEEAYRNTLAHTVRGFGREDIEKAGGITFDQAMEYLFQLNNVQPGYYDGRNRQVVSLIQKGA